VTLDHTVIRENSAIKGPSDKGGGVENHKGGTLTLIASRVIDNIATGMGGGIWNSEDAADPGTVEMDAGSSVTGNTPDDCVGTTAC
jgi:hypothetical protein